MKRPRWWNTPNYYVMMVTLAISCTGALFFSGGSLLFASMYMWFGAPEPTNWEWFLLFSCTVVSVLLALLVHRYDRIISPKFLRRISQKKG